MRGPQLTSLLLVFLASVAAAEDFDGSLPMECTAQKGHDCLPEKNQCSRLKPEGGRNGVFEAIAPMSNKGADGVERADAHAIWMRNAK